MQKEISKEESVVYITSLRKILKDQNCDAIFINSVDEFFNPYPQEIDPVYLLTGFYSAGDASLVVTQNDSIIFTDKRYIPDIYNNLITEDIKVQLTENPQESNIDNMFKYCFVKLPQKLKRKVKIAGSDKNVLYSSYARYFNHEIIQYSPVDINVNNLLTKRISEYTPLKKVAEDVENLVYEDGGRIFDTRSSKICKLHNFFTSNHKNVDALFMQLSAEISYILNLRDYNPLNYSKSIDGVFVLQQDRAFLFTDYKLPEKTITEFKNGIEITPGVFIKIFVFKYSDISKILSSLLPQKSKIAVSNGYISLHNVGIFSSHNFMGFDWLDFTPSHMMSIKSDDEIKGFEISCINDALSYITFMYSITKNNQIMAEDEKEFNSQFIAIKRLNKDYIGESFPAIVAFDKHGKSPHYQTEKSSDTKIDKEGVLVFDFGSQYYYGTTDCTRTFIVNNQNTEPYKKFINDYTYVLKSQIKVLTGIYKKNKTTGMTLDSIARSELWNNRLDFDHSLGHSVDTCLSVHAKFPSLSSSLSPSSLYPLKENMVFSVEPGCYEKKNYGIRLENLVKTVIYNSNYFMLESLTLIPYDKNLINKDLLTEDEILYINYYHDKIYYNISRFIKDRKLKKYLKEITSSL